MTESNFRRRSRPAGLLGALVLIASAESFLAWNEMDYTTSTRTEWTLSRQAATVEAPRHSVLALGTSMAKLGLYPAVVARESGQTAYNLAYCAGRIPGSYHLLKHALEAGARPKAVLLEVHPTYMETPFDDGVNAWPNLLEPADCLDLAWSARDASFFARTMLAKILPSYNCRAEIRASIVGALAGQASQNRHINQIVVRNFARNSGAYVSRRPHPYHGEISPHLANLYLQPTWKSNPLNEQYLRRILDLCTANEIQVFWLIPPFVPTLQALREQLGSDAAYTFWTEKIRQQYPGMIVLDARKAGYDFPYFLDAAHLDFPGAVAFSAEVGRIVKAALERPSEVPRWFPLSPYRDAASDAALEDMVQSARVVDAAAAVRR